MSTCGLSACAKKTDKKLENNSVKGSLFMSRDVKIQKGIPGHIGTDRFHTSTWQTLHIDQQRCSSFFLEHCLQVWQFFT